MNKKQWKFTNERGIPNDNSTKWYSYIPNTKQEEELKETPNTMKNITMYNTIQTETMPIINEGPHSPIFKREPKKKKKSSSPKLKDSFGYFDYFFTSEIPIPSFPYYSKSALISSVVGSKSSDNDSHTHNNFSKLHESFL